MESSWIGKSLIIFGFAIVLVGVIILFSDKIPFVKAIGRLPGDFNFKGENWQVHFPFATSILVSLVATGIFWAISYFSKRGGP